MSKYEYGSVVLQHLLERYSLKERKEELDSTFRIKNMNFEQVQAKDAELFKLLEEVVHLLKLENTRLKVEIIKNGAVDSQIIDKAFNSIEFSPELRLMAENLHMELRRFKVHKAREVLNDKVCDKVGILNRLLGQRKKDDDYMEAMKRELEYIEKLFVTDQYDPEFAKMVTKIQNNIAKVKRQHQTALLVHHHYRAISDTLGAESRNLAAYMDITERALRHNRQELKDVVSIQKEALQMRERYKNELLQLDHRISDDRARREHMSTAMNRQIHSQQHEFDKILKRRPNIPDSIVTEDMHAQIELTKMEILKYSGKFENIKSGILISDVKLIIEAFVNSEDILCELKTRKFDMEKKRQECWFEIEKERNLKIESYMRFQEFENNTKEAILKIKGDTEAEQKRYEAMSSELEKTEEIFLQARRAVFSIFKKLSSVTAEMPVEMASGMQGETHGEIHGENHGETHGENHGETHGENHGETHGENHSETPGETQAHRPSLAPGEAKHDVKSHEDRSIGAWSTATAPVPPEDTELTDERGICELMALCASKLEALLDLIENNPHGKQVHTLMPCILFHEAFENFSNPLPQAVLSRRAESLSADLGMEGAENKVLTRLEMKKKSQALVLLKQKPGAH